MDITPFVDKFFEENAGKSFCLRCVKQLTGIRDYNVAASLEGLWKTTWGKEVKIGVCSECRTVEHVRKIDVRGLTSVGNDPVAL